MNYLRTFTVGTSAAALVVSSLLVAPALATPGSNFAPAPIVNGHFGTLHVNTPGDKTDKWGLILKTLDNTDIGADRLTVQASGYSGAGLRDGDPRQHHLV